MNISDIIYCISNAVEKLSNTGKMTEDLKKELQDLLVKEFLDRLRPCEATYECKFDGDYRDRCDVYVKTDEYQIILEIDAARADQVAKKMLSRYYYANKTAGKRATVYACLLYPGTEKMNLNECIKYMTMGQELLLAINPSNRFIGGLIKDNKVEWKTIG